MNFLRQIGRGFGKQPCQLSAKTAPTTALRGRKTVLVAESDPQAREFTALILRQLGYGVLEAAGIRQVLDAVRRDQGPRVDLLLTDFVIPFTGADELAWQLWSVFPKERALFCCPYPERMARRLWRLEKEIAFLQKPYSAEALARKVQNLLTAATPDSDENAPVGRGIGQEMVGENLTARSN